MRDGVVFRATGEPEAPPLLLQIDAKKQKGTLPKGTITDFESIAVHQDPFIEVLYQIKEESLTDVDISDNAIGDLGAQSVGDLLIPTTKKYSISKLNLDGAQLCKSIYTTQPLDGVITIANAIKTNRTPLTDLSMARNDIGNVKPACVAIGNALAKNKALTVLNLSDNTLMDYGGENVIRALMSNTALTSLDLASNDFSPYIGRVLRDALAKNRTLTTLNLSNNELQAEGVTAMAGGMKGTKLTTIDLSNTDILIKKKYRYTNEYTASAIIALTKIIPPKFNITLKGNELTNPKITSNKIGFRKKRDIMDTITELQKSIQENKGTIKMTDYKIDPV